MLTVTPIVVRVLNSGTDWTALAAVIASSTVGLAGIGSAVWQARRGWHREDERIRKAAKQTAYVNCVTALDAARSARTRRALNPRDNEAGRAHTTALADAVTAVNTLALIAPQDVLLTGQVVLREAADIGAAGMSTPALGTLIQAMRADLSEPPYNTADLSELSMRMDAGPSVQRGNI